MRRVSFLPMMLILFCLPLGATPERGEEESQGLIPVECPRWQPGGQWIIYSRSTSAENEISYLYRIRADGSSLTQVTTEYTGFAIWSPDGNHILYATDDDTNPYRVIDINGTPIKSLGYHPGGDFVCAWSPDGSKIAFLVVRRDEGGPYVAVMDSNGRELFFATRAFDADWHPSGQYLVIQDVANEGHEHLFELNLSTRQRRQITFGNHDDFHPRYSPDGEWIAFVSYTRHEEAGTGSAVWLVRRDGSSLQMLQLGDDPDWDYTPADFSPDGQYLVFGRGKWVPTDLYICRVDGTGLRKLTNFYPDGQAKGQSTLKVAKAPIAPKEIARPVAPVKPAQQAKPAKKEKKSEKKGAPFPLLAPPIPLKRH